MKLLVDGIEVQISYIMFKQGGAFIQILIPEENGHLYQILVEKFHKRFPNDGMDKTKQSLLT